ncbi:hypothetical protein ASG25_19585 [Rhizobium sp. Leaf384]|nr:hypothetical protein ASG25_19585 [Rhizobium sp. Leaf384]KQS75819.1 hypothetical protein ASG58_13265 [Rhizobium sp. Leaf383]
MLPEADFILLMTTEVDMEEMEKKRRSRGQGALGDLTATKQAVMEMQRRLDEERRQKTERLRAQRLAQCKDRDTASGPA